MSTLIENVTDASFENEVLKSSKAVLVDFWAPWCGPCKMVAPILEEIAPEILDTISIRKMDVDTNTEIPAKFSVRGIPTLMIFRNGQVIGQKVGALTKGQLQAFLKAHL
jgi:thioredoxin 1